MPVISIIVPVYKTEKYLRRCIDSVLAQTFTDFECILVDDGSPDNCPVLCDVYAVKDSRIVVVHQKNYGVSAARNAGLDIARGEWIGFVDSDDWCDPDMFRVLYENAVRHDADVSVCSIRIISSDGVKKEYAKNKLIMYNGQKAIIKMLSGGISFNTYSVNRLIKEKLLSENKLRFNTAIQQGEDLLLNYEVFRHTEKVVYFCMPYYNYFFHPESATHQYGLTEQVKAGLDAIEKIILSESDKKIKEKLIAYKFFSIAYISGQYIRQKDYTDDNFLMLKNYIKKNIKYILFKFSVSVKLKIYCCLVFFPFLYRLNYFIWSLFGNAVNRKIGGVTGS
jgi:glycosyltransferase involved in cell wall biosynthesis